MLKSKKGITLIALIITIIVLLILAGISIALVVGDNGVLSNAKKSSQETIVGREKETIAVSWSALTSNKLANDVEITDENFEQELINNGNDVTVSYDEDGNFLVHFNDTGHNYTVNKTGKVNDYDGVVPEEVIVSGPTIKAWAVDSSADFHNESIRNTITEVEFVDLNAVTAPTEINGTSSWDVSVAGDQSVIAWLDGTKLYIGGENGVIANENSSYIFYSFPNLTNIVFANKYNTSNVINMSYMFANSVKLESLDLRSFNTSRVTDMSYMFFGGVDWDIQSNMSITEIKLESFDTRNVTNMHGIFANCGNLTVLDISNFDTKNVTNMASMFNGPNDYTSKLESIVFGPNWNTSKVTTMKCMFCDCISLVNLNVSNFDTKNVTDMYFMFCRCQSLSSLDLSGFNTGKVTDMEYMFSECGSLTSLDLSNFNTSNVTTMVFMFYNCISLTSLDVSNFNTSNVTNMHCMFGGRWDTEEYMSLTEIRGLENFNTSKVTNMEWMFGQCRYLTSLDLSNFNTSNVTTMATMFSDCSNLISLDVSGFDTRNVTRMHGMFSNCASLTSLDVSSFDTRNVTDMGNMFDMPDNGTSNLETIYVSENFVTTNVTESNYMFADCVKLVGANGTRYSLSYTTKTYARIDLSGQPGYFTLKTD